MESGLHFWHIGLREELEEGVYGHPEFYRLGTGGSSFPRGGLHFRTHRGSIDSLIPRHDQSMASFMAWYGK